LINNLLDRQILQFVYIQTKINYLRKYIEFMKEDEKVKEYCKKYCKNDAVYTWIIMTVGHFLYYLYILL